eukprot:11746055-Alexandrium_andersonii.AAC.1
MLGGGPLPTTSAARPKRRGLRRGCRARRTPKRRGRSSRPGTKEGGAPRTAPRDRAAGSRRPG